MILERGAGVLAGLLVLVCWYTASVFGGIGEELIGMPVWQFATAVKVFCWVMQFYGHGVHEGRSPALLDNLFQAVVMAPLFVFLEVCFKLFNYRKDMQVEIQKDVDAAIAQWKASKKNN